MISEHFTLEEFTKTSHKEVDNKPNIQAITNIKALVHTILEPLRKAYNKPITITSGYRSKELNTIVGGSKTSQHLQGAAADIKGEDIQELWNIAVNMVNNNKIQVGQLIDEKNLRWIHISLPTKNKKNEIKHIK